MRMGVPREIKTQEYRVGLTPSSVREIVHHGHQVVVETNAGLGANFDDEAYQAVGAEIVPDAAAVFADAEMIVKVKEPQVEEFPGKVEIPQRLYERHMDEEFEPAGLSRFGELVEELSHVNHKRGEHPTYSKYGPLRVVMVQVSVTEGQIDQKGIYISANVHRRQH